MRQVEDRHFIVHAQLLGRMIERVETIIVERCAIPCMGIDTGGPRISRLAVSSMTNRKRSLPSMSDSPANERREASIFSSSLSRLAGKVLNGAALSLISFRCPADRQTHWVLQ